MCRLGNVFLSIDTGEEALSKQYTASVIDKGGLHGGGGWGLCNYSERANTLVRLRVIEAHESVRKPCGRPKGSKDRKGYSAIFEKCMLIFGY